MTFADARQMVESATLGRIPVRLDGEWKPVAYVGHVRWEGTATADEPITALALYRDTKSIHWARVGREPKSTLHLSLTVAPADESASRYAVSIGVSMGPEEDSTGHGLVHLTAPGTLTSTAPFIFSLDHAETGSLSWFATARTVEDLRFGALFRQAGGHAVRAQSPLASSIRMHVWKRAA